MSIARNNPKIAQALADPSEYENLFEGMKDSYKTEEYLSPKRQVLFPASSYVDTVVRYAHVLLKFIIIVIVEILPQHSTHTPMNAQLYDAVALVVSQKLGKMCTVPTESRT